MTKNPLPAGLGSRQRAAVLFVLLACLGMSRPSAALIALGPLYPQTWFPTDSDARVLMGRFDADSAIDLVTSARGAILVRLNDGHARFLRVLGANVEPKFHAAAVGDFTGDGVQDVLIADSDVGLPGILAILPGNGDGTLGAAIGATPYSGNPDFVVGDLNADGKDDLVSVNRATVASAPSQVASPEPLVGESLAAVRIFVAEPEVARRWLLAVDAVPPRESPVVRGEELAGVDEADIVGLYVVLTGTEPSRAARLLEVFQHGDHSLLIRLPASMVVRFGQGAVDQKLVVKVNRIAAQLRGKPKDAEWVQLSIDGLRNIGDVCRGSKGQPVFIHFSE